MQKRSAPKGMNVFVLASDIIIGVKPKIDDFCQIAKKIEVFFFIKFIIECTRETRPFFYRMYILLLVII